MNQQHLNKLISINSDILDKMSKDLLLFGCTGFVTVDSDGILSYKSYMECMKEISEK